MSKFKDMSDDYLRQNYVPAVYQPSIYAIDYQKLKDAGIKLISFDVDDTIADLLSPNPPKSAITRFVALKNMGFTLMLLSNSWDKRVEHFADKLGIGDQYIPNAKKPLEKNFDAMKDRFGMEKSQMAHVGNSLLDDVAGGKGFGITTCLVRRIGIAGKIVDTFKGPEEQEVGEELEKRGIWRKHHLKYEGNQYYQLGETQKFSPHFKG